MKEMKTVATGQFEGSRKFLRSHSDRKDDKVSRFIKKILKRKKNKI
jgi:hypothetical protein